MKEGVLKIEVVEEMPDVRRLEIKGTLIDKGKKVWVNMQVSINMGKWKYSIYNSEKFSYIKAPFGLGDNYPQDEFVLAQILNDETFKKALEECAFYKEMVAETKTACATLAAW